MGQRDIKANVKEIQLFTKIARSATATIQGVDVSEFGGAMFALDVGAWTADDLTVTFQESDDNSAWTDIADKDLDGSDNDVEIVTGIASAIIYANYRGIKKYIGAKITDGGTGDAIVGVLAIMGFPKDIPAT